MCFPLPNSFINGADFCLGFIYTSEITPILGSPYFDTMYSRGNPWIMLSTAMLISLYIW